MSKQNTDKTAEISDADVDTVTGGGLFSGLATMSDFKVDGFFSKTSQYTVSRPADTAHGSKVPEKMTEFDGNIGVAPTSDFKVDGFFSK